MKPSLLARSFVAVLASVLAASAAEPLDLTWPKRPTAIPEVPRDRVIGFALYTTQNGVLKLSAQLFPLKVEESREVTLELDRGDGKWGAFATQKVDDDHWHTCFRVEGWDESRDGRYRLTHPGGAVYEGRVRRDPVEKESIVVAGLSCNSNQGRDRRDDVVRNIQAQDPDMVFFAGDQSYDHREHLFAWLLFGWQFGEVMRDRPSVTIPDDHDVGHGNLWGDAGRKSTRQAGDDGGYFMPVEYVNMVQRAQTAHLPDPIDPTPVARGITVYYTRLQIGRVDFAIIEDRKWKTGPAGLVPMQGPRSDHINDPGYDRQSIDVHEARLLGDRQLAFLDRWGQDWTGADVKCVLSQTIFCGGAHIHGGQQGRLLADLDSNGWPQAGRNRALIAMRKAFAFHIAGDQHLATMIHHGVNDWEDAGWSFCVPSIMNYYPRWWKPLEEGLAHDPASPLPYTGRYYDGFGNKVTMAAYANPAPGNEQGAGYGLVRFNNKSRVITAECWPRHVDVTKPGAQQYPGWPVKIPQLENYGRVPMGYLPAIELRGGVEPVVQVVDEWTGDVVYTIRAWGKQFRPPVYKTTTTYTVRIGEGGSVQEHTGQAASPLEQPSNAPQK
ncbi:PhoD-like phosphatase [Pirellulimonas nuda]|uniref:PhoD-like phosphatase n=1 Tax=Pirellulimonas nuda TaxID=2528009 RepID=A0A518D9B7_9BACT|nr:hypothetical protein [Pirellulimonas nuda]QDU88064.1 PhoD-like phosphatase [Pirellulimonas nuda]